MNINNLNSKATKHASEIESQGYTLIPNTLNEDQIREATAAILEVYKTEHDVAKGVDTQTDHALCVHHLFAKTSVFRGVSCKRQGK